MNQENTFTYCINVVALGGIQIGGSCYVLLVLANHAACCKWIMDNCNFMVINSAEKVVLSQSNQILLSQEAIDRYRIILDITRLLSPLMSFSDLFKVWLVS